MSPSSTANSPVERAALERDDAGHSAPQRALLQRPLPRRPHHVVDAEFSTGTLPRDILLDPGRGNAVLNDTEDDGRCNEGEHGYRAHHSIIWFGYTEAVGPLSCFVQCKGGNP